ncbi:hypothetical protein Y032_0092g2522 [Ancylostoma ceylanicum]|uniref:Uncharacterized protein n=1 Tax=Ancylostoma ceylanicum TaxID=53326 RepID=A0A016TM72_9BILA|nr:hypothetical protein Y032_0092g2522 [Ancylostoma ceylanicum]
MRVILTLLAVLGCTLPAVYKMQLKKVTPEMIKMLRSGTWAKYIEEKQDQRNRMDGDHKHDVSCIVGV